MKKLIFIPSALALTTFSAIAQTPAPAVAQLVEQQPQESELDALTQKNTLQAEKLKEELADLRAKISKLKLERELLTEQQLIEDLKQTALEKAELKASIDLEAKLEREASIAKSKAALAASELSLQKTKLLSKTSLQEAELEAIKINNQRENFADNKPVYLENPLQDADTLVISDRRIGFNGPVTSESADHICDRIHYFNNKDKKLPIFIVIDSSPGGSVMAGYRILKAMEGSDAPVHVVVKSFAASMAATITTLAEESYAYPNAIILHHQLSSSFMFSTMNLTQQKESYEDAKRWWNKLATPVAKKMGISTDEFIKQMYGKNSDGDWFEFATEAKKLKWVNHIVTSIKETSARVNPDTIKPKKTEKDAFLSETVGNDGKPCLYLPRLNPHDAYFLYNPDGYYRVK
ncbi:MAG: ATP-dependent Clp protease proteolytic subunit [Akkermansiaceae bacterium]